MQNVKALIGLTSSTYMYLMWAHFINISLVGNVSKRAFDGPVLIRMRAFAGWSEPSKSAHDMMRSLLFLEHHI